jgi:ribosomal protein L37AE/L43A
MSEETPISRENICPKCKSRILAREGIFIFCTEHTCDWAVQSKRKEDVQIPLFSELRREFNG